MPETKHKFQNHNACLDHLIETASQLSAKATQRTATEGRGFISVSIEDMSGGVKIEDHKKAYYRAMLWRHRGVLIDQNRQFLINHQWEETDLHCKGNILISKGSQGYTLHTYENANLQTQ